MRWSIETCIDKILSRQVSAGGFTQRPDGDFRPDATAWSILALSGESAYNDIIVKACRHLAQKQLSDGRVPIYDGCDDVYWPIPLAILAWEKANG